MVSWLHFQVDCVDIIVNEVLLGQDFHLFPLLVVIPPLLHTHLSLCLGCPDGLTYQLKHDFWLLPCCPEM
jgi:hypothetical protein